MSAPAGIVWLASFPEVRQYLVSDSSRQSGGPLRSGSVGHNGLEERGGIAGSRQEFEAQTLLDSSWSDSTTLCSD